MKFTIEVLRLRDGAEEVLTREHVNAIAPKWAQSRAQRLFNAWKPKGATGVRVLNLESLPIYKLE